MGCGDALKPAEGTLGQPSESSELPAPCACSESSMAPVAPLSAESTGGVEASDMASGLLRKALDALARLDVQTALVILKEDDLIDQEFDGFVRKLITYMMEDPRTISPSLDLLFLAKAIERIGDHAKNIAEFIIYIVKGADVRHTSLAEVESVVR